MKRLLTLSTVLTIGVLSVSTAMANPQHFGGWQSPPHYYAPAPMERQPYLHPDPGEGYRAPPAYSAPNGYRGGPPAYAPPIRPPLGYRPYGGYGNPDRWHGPEHIWNEYWGFNVWRGMSWYWYDSSNTEIWLWVPDEGCYRQVPVYYDQNSGQYYYVLDGVTNWLQ